MHPALRRSGTATAADLAALPDDAHAEVIAGELVEKAAPSYEHGDAQSSLAELLKPPFQRGRGGPGGWWIATEVEIQLETHGFGHGYGHGYGHGLRTRVRSRIRRPMQGCAPGETRPVDVADRWEDDPGVREVGSLMAETASSRHPLTLAFLDPALERAFQVEIAVVNAPHIRAGALASIALWLLADVLARATTTFHTGVAFDLVCVGMALANALGFAFAIRADTMNRYQIIGLALNGLAGLAVLVLLELSGASDRLAGLAILLIAMFAFVAVRLRFVFALVAAGMYLLGFAAIVFGRQGQGGVFEAFLVAGAIGVGLAGTYQLERGARDVYAQRRMIEAQAAALREAQANSERLLLNVLPGSIADRLKRGEKTIVDAFDDATVLFADLVGFTPLAARLSPRATLALLDRLFTGYDELAERHGLEKIKTIGDAYMVVGGLPEPSTDHPERVVAMGLDMLSLVAIVAEEFGHRLELRVGVHTGPLAAGVIGTRKFSYDLWGDTVNLASRLESHGVVGSIQISEATWRRVKDKVDAVSRGQIQLKGRGDIAAFLVTPKPS